jgi:hypothetical protein
VEDRHMVKAMVEKEVKNTSFLDLIYMFGSRGKTNENREKRTKTKI